MSTRVSVVAARVVVATGAFGFVTAIFSAGCGQQSDRQANERPRLTSAPTAVARTIVRPPLVCRLRPGTTKLPASSRRGLIDHLLQYPDVTLATPRERARAHRVLAQLESAAANGHWRRVPAAERAGYDTRTRVRKSVTARCTTSTRSDPRSPAAGSSSILAGPKPSSTRTRRDGPSSSSGRCGAPETASGARIRAGP
jgi:hypothetical protein